MQQDASNAKQLVVERVRQSTNILVAVSANPSVDALAAALAVALMLNKMDKHATAVFSGAMPPAMEFLEPDKTFENSVDSLRDFIISLDKEKADRLRYKVEDDVVRIFITPYRTIISEKDLQFGQGDFNVDLILALGVEKREDLDKAIIAHGRILHDATVMTVNASSQQSNLGAVNWHEPAASSLCEMLVSLGEAFQQPGLLDQQIATALLTGIVAATDRFSNHQTTPRVMTMAAQLMAAGANQQLIANNLIKAHELPQSLAGSQLVPGADSVKLAEEKAKKDGELDIEHPKKPEQKPDQKQPNQQTSSFAAPADEPKNDQQKQNQNQNQQNQQKKNKNKNYKQSAEDELSAALPSAAAATSAFDELKSALENEGGVQNGKPEALKEHKAPGSQSVNGSGDDETASKKDEGFVVGSGSWRGRRLEPPVLGGTLSATAEQAMDDSQKAQEEERNKKLLTHPESAEKAETETKPPASKPANEKENKEVSEKPKPQPTPKPEPAPAPEQVSQPSAAPEPEPAAQQPEPTPVSAPTPPALPPSLPLPPETSAPTMPLPEAQLPSADAAANEAAAIAKPADATGSDLNAARQAVSDALQSQPFNPASQPLQSVGAMPMEITNEPIALNPEPQPVQTPAPAINQPQAVPEPQASLPPELPPLPPMPPLPQFDANQPLPQPPALQDAPPAIPNDIPPAPITPPPEAPKPEPTQAPPDPRQFKIPGA